VLTDTHCHLDLESFDSDREAVLERALQAGVERILIPGINLTSSHSAVELAHTHPKLYAAIGVHPTEAETWDEDSKNELKKLALTPYPFSESGGMRGKGKLPSGASGFTDNSGTSKIVAVGEIGLDYYWNAVSPDLQKKVLREQLGLAAELGLPVILHMREAKDAPTGACAADLLTLLREWTAVLKADQLPLADRPGVLHSFSGSLETAREAIELGFCIGVTGPVTFENARRRQEIIAALPLERLLIETDAPFLAPHPQRGKRNEPAYVRLIADKIGLLHSRPAEVVATATSENALRLFKWK
jgi:TatD DNase family protein